MVRLISVDPSLEQVKDHLSGSGYEVVDSTIWVRPVEAVVYSGAPLPAGRAVRAPGAANTALVNAAGLTPEEVADQIENKLG